MGGFRTAYPPEFRRQMVELVRAGRSRPIEEFVKEVGRHLPAPASR